MNKLIFDRNLIFTFEEMKENRILPNFDFLGLIPSLSVKNGSSSYQTTIGGINSILTVISILLLFFWYLVYQMAFSPSYSIVVATELDNVNDHGQLKIGDDTFFSFFAADQNFQPIILDPNLFNITIVSQQINYNLNTDGLNLNNSVIFKCVVTLQPELG